MATKPPTSSSLVIENAQFRLFSSEHGVSDCLLTTDKVQNVASKKKQQRPHGP